MRRVFPLLLVVAAAACGGGEPSGGGGEAAAPAADQPALIYQAKYSAEGARQWRRVHPVSARNLTGPMEMYELTRFPNAVEPTAAQRQAADDLLARCRAVAERKGWHDFDVAQKEGFALTHGDGIHYGNVKYITDDHILDPEHPEILMYYPTSKGLKLAGYMFLVRRPDAHGPQIGGPLTLWHYHVWQQARCLLGGIYVVGLPAEGGLCAQGVPGHQSPEMLHVWLVDHPDGPFATGMTLPEDSWKQKEVGHHGH
jgi:hypothetical protein